MPPVLPVLVIEDDAFYSSIVSKMLMQRSFQPILCETMEDALKYEGPVHIVISDIYMPGMGGIVGISKLRDTHADIKIIAMSGGWEDMGIEETLVAARKIGANWALKKPFSADELNEAIANVLDGRVQETPVQAEDTRPTLHVVIADDDPMMGKIISSTVGELVNGRIDFFEDATNIVTMLEVSTHPDMIITDLNMPELDGLTLLRHLSENNYTGGVCLISGEDRQILKSAERLAASHNLNVTGIMEKPLTMEAMSKAIDKLVTAKADRRQHPREMITEEKLREAIRDGRVEVHYQPKVSTRDGKLVGAEALIRWRYPELGLLYPNSFIPFAEKHGLIDLLTDAMIFDSLETLGFWKKRGLDLKISINLSTFSLERLDFPEYLTEIAARNNCTNDSIIVELTESGLPESSANVLEVLTRLRLKGFGLSFDDFGTGYSSLTRLEESPFNELKIDRSFVAGVSQDKDKQAILNSSVEMARNLDLTSVAEGVETQQDWDYVKSIGINMAQGYFIAKPLPAGAFLEWEQKWRLKHS